MTTLILTVVGIVIFTIYSLAEIITNKALPPSLSESYYIFEDKKKGAGWAFTAMMWVVGFILMIGWIEVNESFTDWRKYFSFLPFLMCAAIIFVGAAPQFRDYRKNPNSLITKVHEIAAKIAAAFAVLWVIISNASIEDWWIILVALAEGFIIPFGLTGVLKCTKKCFTWAIEMTAFIAAFTSSLYHCIINVL